MTTPLHGPANLRDLGGLPLDGGGVTRAGVLYRSDAWYAGDEAPAALPAWPPALVVDLRSQAERDLTGTFRWPQPVKVCAVPLLDDAAPLALEEGLGSIYRRGLAASAGLIARVAALVATAPGPALVHCAVGKDRTGVVVAAILLAAGVTPGAVTADYTATEPHLPQALARLAAQAGYEPPPIEELPRAAREAPASAIAEVIEVLSATPGGAAGWLASHGMSDGDLRQLRAKLRAAPGGTAS